MYQMPPKKPNSEKKTNNVLTWTVSKKCQICEIWRQKSKSGNPGEPRRPEMITIRFAGWISCSIVSLQPDPDIQKLFSNGNRIRIRISETLLSIFREFRLFGRISTI